MALQASDRLPHSVELPTLAGFWQRVTALLLDILLLGVPLLLLGLVLFDWAISLGESGRLVGFVVALAYFGLLNSRIGDGQTIGKRVMAIRVVDRDGNMLSAGRSLLRFLVIGVPYFANGLQFSASDAVPPALWSVVEIALSLIVVGGFGAALYLYVFNRRTRQSLHDIAVGSFVIREAATSPSPGLAIPRLHLIVVGCWFTVAVIIPIVGLWTAHDRTAADGPDPLAELRRVVGSLPGIGSATVIAGSTATFGVRAGTSASSWLKINARATGREDLDVLVRSIGATVLERHPDLLGNRMLVVQVQRGFDFGLAAWSWRQQQAHDAAKWREISQQAPASPVKTP